ncbi:MAG TPA: ergothioneine biosynthesis protein EgtB [Planctomycetaceae bacterium]|jgi:ergothioneine biosynthesis protein EgtB|nr:ergothioneine biosynthesis protein EgtB [Planctomycetaceae bacterium]
MLGNLAERYAQTRQFTERLCEPLAIEDFVVQSMPDASPTRWHLAHTTWFFETFVLARWEENYRPANADFQVLFNSYYNGVGEAFPRARRGLLTRPTVAEVFEYRRAVDERMARLLHGLRDDDSQETAGVVELGINHEQQHQELLITDIKHAYSCNPQWPRYRQLPDRLSATNSKPGGWSSFEGGVVEIGHRGRTFAFDNERPRHKTFLQPFEIQNRLVATGEFLDFVNDGGYRRPGLWLSLGWSIVCDQKWAAPLYWVERDGNWHEFTLGGLRRLNVEDPVCHVSYFEADAFARWSGARIPTEAEWEHAAMGVDVEGSFVEGERYHPARADNDHAGLAQMYGEVWQWTASPYTPYPGFVPPSGALGEYNAKFMCNQYVLRGGSCATPANHMRPTYRNFFPPEARWQFAGIRLARDTQG